MEDDRLVMAPDCLSFRDLAEFSTGAEFASTMRELWGEQVEWARYTIVSPEHPMEPYPHGWYFEGWSKAPWKHDPPGKEGPFNYPMTAIAQNPPEDI